MPQTDRAAAERIMSHRGWLPLLPEAFRTEVLRRSILLQFAPGQAVFRLSDPMGGIYGLASGVVSVSIAPSGSTPRLILLGVPGHWTGEGCFLTRTPRRGELRAVTDTTMLHLPLDVMDQLAEQNPEVAHHVALMLMMSVESFFASFTICKRPSRTADCLGSSTSDLDREGSDPTDAGRGGHNG